MRTLLSVVVSFGLGASGLVAASHENLEAWLSAAAPIIASHEGSSFSAVTGDGDLQGLSLGVMQWTISSGSIGKLIDKVGLAKSQTLAKQLMPNYGDQFSEILGLISKGGKVNYDKARLISLGFQELGTKTVGNTQIEYGKRVLPAARQELELWLMTPEVQQAQREVFFKSASQALAAAKLWKGENDDNTPVTFPEFLFFLDAFVQGGSSGYMDNAFGKATELVRGGFSYTPGKSIEDAKSLRRQMLGANIVEFLRGDWKNANNPGFVRDARKNADLLEPLIPTLTTNELQLIYMKILRGFVGNAPFQLTYINRGIVDVLGQGYVNGKYQDFRNIYKERKPLVE